MENQDEELLKQQIETELEKCPSIEICSYIQNPNSKKFAIEYVYKQVTKFGASLSGGIGRFESYLEEIK